MDEIERKLMEEKKQMKSIKAPEEMQSRLKKTLDGIPPNRKKRTLSWAAAAAALLLLSFAGYQYDALAYYSKQLVGYEEIMPSAIAALHEEGNGQPIEKEVSFEDGSHFKADLILSDENQLILYYTVTNPAGVDENRTYFMKLRGFLTDSAMTAGTFTFNEQKTEMKGMQTFEPVSAFAKELTLEIYGGEENISAALTFPYNPNEALETALKKKIKKTLQVDGGEVRFQSITATPTQTMVEGKMKVGSFDRLPLGFDGVQLFADGQPLEHQGASVSTAFNGDKFAVYFDALPADTHSLQLVFETFIGYKEIAKKVELSGKETVADLDGAVLKIKNPAVTEDGTVLTILTKEQILLDGVSAYAQGKEMPLVTLLAQDYIEEDGIEYKRRSLLFDGHELPDALSIDHVYYEKKYDVTFDILKAS